MLVSGKGKHKTQLQRDYETLLSLLAKRKQYQKDLATFGDRKSFSKTDEDATFMHMKEDHMKNGQLTDSEETMLFKTNIDTNE